MEYTKRRRITITTEATDLQELYPHDLQMYDVPPEGEVPFTEFQELGLDRLKLLQLIENNAVGTDYKTMEERKLSLSNALKKDGLKYFQQLLHATGGKSFTESDLQARRKDRLSHFIMRLSYCQDPDRITWFIKQEVEFFRLRFSSLHKEGVEQLLSMHSIDCQQITQEEKDDLREDLHLSTPRIANIDTTEFYKVPFQRVIDLVSKRRTYVKEGMAIISQSDLISLFVTHFKKILLDGAEYAKGYLSNISDDERLTSYFKSLPGSFSGMTRIVWSTMNTPVEKLDELSKSSYPLCMRSLHDALRTNHHLKNSGRMQYGLFLKGIGVTLDDALRFWRTEFTRKIEPDKFDKQYAYSIRHSYGKEGKQTNYTPFGCPKIIASAVGPGEHHGCPYKHMDHESLKQKLFGYGVPPNSITEIVDLANEGHYLIACTKYFEAMHNRLPEKALVHPNAYFQESRAILGKDEPGAESDSQDKLSQSSRLSGTPQRGAMDRSSFTPSRNMDRSSFTPSRNLDRLSGTPSRNLDRLGGTPSRSADIKTGTPTRSRQLPVPKRLEEKGQTPAKKTSNAPAKSEMRLNDDEIAEFLNDM